MALKLEHYLPLLERKLRAVDRALPVKLWLDAQQPCWRILLHELRRQHGEYEGSKDFVTALTMCGTHGTETMTEAVTRACRRPTISMATLRFELDGLLSASRPKPKEVSYDGPAVRSASARDYDSILEVTRG